MDNIDARRILREAKVEVSIEDPRSYSEIAEALGLLAAQNEPSQVIIEQNE